MVAAQDMAEDLMQGRHLHPGGMEVVDLRKDMTSIGPSLSQGLDLLLDLHHTLGQGHGHRHHAEVATIQTHGPTGVEARATAAMGTAVEVGAQSVVEVAIDIQYCIFQNQPAFCTKKVYIKDLG